MTKRKPKKPQPPRLTITLENSMGIAKQTWVGTPKDFKMSWPVDVMTLLGERMACGIRTPNEIKLEATLEMLGSFYRTDHSQ